MSAASQSHSRAGERPCDCLRQIRSLSAVEDVGFGARNAASERGAGWQAGIALRWRSECVHSSLAKDADGRSPPRRRMVWVRA
eukprot:4068578-Prymnesium_polylepis.1